MTDEFRPPDPEAVPPVPEPAPPPRRRRVWPWVLAGVLTVLALVVAFLPTLLGGLLVRQFGGPAGVSAGRVGGTLWAPRIEDLKVAVPGVQATAGMAGVTVRGVDVARRVVTLDVAAADATVNLKLQQLFGSSGAPAGGGGSGWTVKLGTLDVQRTRVTVDGGGASIPDGQFTVQRGSDGTLAVRGTTKYGPANADVRVTPGTAGNIFTISFDADARIAQEYWPGVSGGRLAGQYVIGDGPLRGDVKLTDGVATVPEAKFVTVTGITGGATHRGDNISFKLAGTGWNGPVTATGGVDLKAQHWTVTADAAPTVGGLARALGTTGSGGLTLRVTAGGWSTVRVKAYAKGAGTLAGVEFSRANAEYSFLNENGQTAPQTNDLAFSTDTALAGASQRIEGRWAFNRTGRATVAGTFGQKALDVQATIDAQNTLSFSGSGLGGPLRGTLALAGLKLNAALNPTYGAAQARVAITGVPSDLRAVITNGQAGPFPLAGTAALDGRGLRVDLGTAAVDLDRSFRGTWRARNLQGAGLTLDGAGRIDLTGGDVTGTLAARVPGLTDTLRGPLDVNYVRQEGTFAPGGQRLTWAGDAFRASVRGLRATGGLNVDGDVTVTTTLKAFGTVTAQGNGFSVTATGRGTRASVRAVAGGVTVLADTGLSAPYDTTARVQGADIQGTLSMDQGVRFTLTTRGDTARGVIDGQNVTASGRVNLASLRPLLRVPDLAGTLDLNLAGTGGTARVDAAASGVSVAGTLTRAAGAVNAALTARAQGAVARVTGRVFPDVQTTGTVTAQGQTLNVGVSGPYGALSARATGRTGDLAFGGVTIPAQAVNLRGTLTPRLAVSGTWGDLSATYDAATGLARVSGQQALTAFGQAGRVQGRATWGPPTAGSAAWRGAVDLSGVLDQYTLSASGPWNALNLLVTDAEGLQARGTAALPDGRYTVDVRGPIAGQTGQKGLYVDGHIEGRGTEPRGQVTVTDGVGGRATVALRGFSDFDVQAQGLTLAGQTLTGDLSARANVLSGALTAGPLAVTAAGGRIRATGTFAAHTVTASGRLTLPATVSDLNVRVRGPYLDADARGGIADLRGTVTVKAMSYGTDPARVTVPAQTFPLTASVTGARATVGGLTYRAGTWVGALQARYTLAGTPGALRLVGTGSGLAAVPSGPVTGRVTVLPALGGTLQASLSPFAGLLPEALRPEITPGQLTAQLAPTSATLALQGTRYQGDPLGLDARVSWQGGLRASGTLSHPGTRLPVRYDGQTLSIAGAVLDARALRPVLPGAQGRATLDVQVPGLDIARASARARVDLRAQGQRAAGSVRLVRGQLSADLTSSLGGVPIRVRGPLYPSADATLTYQTLTGTLRGAADSALTLRVTGTYQQQAVNLTATATGLTGTQPALRVAGRAAGADVTLAVTRSAGTGLDGWKTTGSVVLADLKPLTGSAGTVQATVGGTLADLRVTARGEAAGVAFTAPLSYRDSSLRVAGATARLPLGTVRASGTVLPDLALSARATLTSGVPGTYLAQIGGTFARPDVSVQGRLSGGVAGLQAAGTILGAHLLGQDYRAVMTGPRLAGSVRGQLGSNALGGLLDAQLKLDTTYLAGPTRVDLRGTPGWNLRRGWSGTLRATGTVPGGPLDAVLDGAGALKLAGMVGLPPQQARVTGTLPASLPFRPGGTVTLAALDAGALWGRADQLRVSGTATLGGRTWSALEAAFQGAVADSGDDLSGDVSLSYRAGNVGMRLVGPRVSGSGRLNAGRYDVTLRAQPVRVARLLPAGLNIPTLDIAGTVAATGTLSGGPQSVTVRSLAVRGEQGQAGPFSVYGSATYTPQRIDAALSGSLRGGVLSAQGALPDGVRITVRDLATSYVGAASLGQGTLGASVTVRGRVTDPTLEGTVSARTDLVDALLTVAGRAADPHLTARATLLGAARGTLYADLSDLDLPQGRVTAHVYGTAGSGGTEADLDLRGTWPQLAGTMTARVAGLTQPVTLAGDGRGTYRLDAGPLGGGSLTLTRTAGFLPALSGALSLTPLPVVGGLGSATVDATLGGTLAAPTVAAQLATRGASVSGVGLNDTTGTVAFTQGVLSGTLAQRGATVATLQGSAVTLSGLALDVAGSRVAVSGRASLPGTADVTVAASGTVDGTLRATYAARALAVQGRVTGPQDLEATVNLRLDPLTGWHGGAQVRGGPAGVLTSPAELTVSGPLAFPRVGAQAGVLGAGARIVATARYVQLRLVDGPGASASGVVELRPDGQGEWSWIGAAQLTRPELGISVTPSGPLADPSVLLSVRRGEWRASGTASLRSADLTVTDGERDGRVTWNGSQVAATLPGLRLSRLNLPGYDGTVTASGQVQSDGQAGALNVRLEGLQTPLDVPYLGIDLSGDVRADITLSGGQPAVRATATLPAGTLTLDAAQVAGRWTGRVGGQVTREAGTLAVDIGADANGLTGTATLNDYPVEAAGQNLALDGTLTLAGQTFTAALTAASGVGSASVDASGGIADVLPAASSVLAVAPTDQGYSVRATLDGLEVRDLKLAPGLSGPLSGEATLRDGGGTFVVQADPLTIGSRTLPARIEGTQVSGDWRIRGFLGESEFTAGLSGGEVFGQGSLRALPLGAVVGAVAGTTPGEGVLTGVVRFRFPLGDPLAGSATVVAERIRVSATSMQNGVPMTDTLIGSGSLDFAARELRSVNIQLAGAGTWDVRGQYTRQKVDLTAQFTDTTFTPVLQLVPALADLDTTFKGTVVLSAAGTYDRPRAAVRVQNVSGSVAGLSVQVPRFAGDLPDSGAFTAGGRVLTGGAVGTDGTVTIRGQLTLGTLSGTAVTFQGLLAPQALGALPNTTAVLAQESDSRWSVNVQSRSASAASGTGTLSVTGDIAPRWNLRLAARNYNLPLAVVYGRDSALNADLSAVDDGTVIRVTGAADFLRLTLGRVDAPTTIPSPGQSTAAPTTGRTTDNYASPLPEAYTTFPRPAEEQAAPAARPFLQRLVLEDIPIRAPNGIRVDENLVRAEFSGNLRVSGTGARPLLAGTIQSQRGFIYLRENEFTLQDSTVTFDGSGLYPAFDIAAQGTVPSSTTGQNVPVGVSLKGQFVTRPTGDTVLDLTTTLSCTQSGPACSDPATSRAYTEPELYALVATGVPNLTALPQNLGSLGTSALQTALNVFVLGEVERTIARAFGLDVFRFTPQLANADGSLGATLTFGSYLGRNLYLQYQVNLNGEGLIDATYNTPDNRFTFRVSTPITGLDLQSLRPNFSTAYNISPRTSVSIGVENTPQTTRVRFGVIYRFGQ
ncbi:translocation/assembly module TamB domain-containing protein [Deinococcus sp. AB2017081]|uniref:translocation/assembly module TamB domain-containing protein n=1 Tax=Deinococcus sp. AB2017081 TaxID=3093660 RepID=UPI002ACC04F7|nr:translocation/assembly module TamB domain-containing protein [Deinococcus sp. AB2017081]WQE93681.1 translocation/assembly module TamB domain-containing protein [Deinococcus sp. AB2017081]